MPSPSLETIRKSITHVWDFLTRPSNSVTERQARQESRLFSSMLLAAILVVFFLILFSIHTSNTFTGADVWLVVSFGIMISVGFCYFLTRNGYVRFAIGAVLILATVGIFVPALVVGGPGSYNSLFYLFTVTLFASTFLPMRIAVLAAVFQIGLLFIFQSSFPQISAQAIISGPFSFNLFLSVFMLLLSYHQRRAIGERREELSASEERYRLVTGLISDYAYSLKVGTDGSLTHEWITEDSFRRLTGYWHDELDKDGNVNLALFLPEDEAALQKELDVTLQNKPNSVQHRIRTKGGDIRWVQLSRLPVWDVNENRVTRYYGVAQDVTERKRAEIALKTSEERYRLLTETISDFVMLYDVPTKQIVYISPSYEKAMGYTLAELNKLTSGERVHPDDFEVSSASMEQVVRGVPVEGVQYRSRKKNGQYLWLEIYSNPIKDDQGNVLQVIVSGRDITFRKQTETALQASEERYRIISELISDYAYFFRIDPDGTRHREWITESVARVTGYTPDEMPQETSGLASIFYAGDVMNAEDDLHLILAGEQINREFRITTKQGDLRWLNVLRRPVWDDNHSRVIGYYGVAQDITERKQAELALQASEERYRILTELTSDYAYFFRINPDGSQYREWITESVERVTGYRADEMPQQPDELAKIFYPDDIHRAVREVALLKQGEIVNSESRLRTKSGDLRWLSILRRPVWDDEHSRVVGYYGVAKDITDRKLAELALRGSEQRYRKISELISDYAFYTRIDVDGKMEREWITDSFFRVTGYLPKEIDAYGAPILFHPDSLALLSSDTEKVLSGQAVSNEYRIITKQGAVRWLSLVREPVWDEAQGRVVGYFGVAKDITEHKQIEAQKLKLILEQEQFVLVSQLVEALSHDFRTSLATIETSRYLVERLIDDKSLSIVQPKLQTIQQSVHHLATQLENLYLVSFLTTPTPTPCNLNYLVNGIISEQSAKAAQKHIHLNFVADQELPVLRLDGVKIEKAIRHLVANALTHTPDNGNVTVYTRHTVNHAIIEVEDTGAGIAPAVVERIFEPFFRADQARTVEKGGVGLGLTIVKMIVEAHGGTVTVHSRAGEGSRFVLTLPLKEDLAVSA